MDTRNYCTASDGHIGIIFHYKRSVTNWHEVLNFKARSDTQLHFNSYQLSRWGIVIEERIQIIYQMFEVLFLCSYCAF